MIKFFFRVFQTDDDYRPKKKWRKEESSPCQACSGNSIKCTDGPITRSQKRKLDQSPKDSSESSFSDGTEAGQYSNKDSNIHRIIKSEKRSKRLATVIVE